MAISRLERKVMPTKLTPLPNLSAKLLELTGSPGPGYRRCYLLALDGKLPTVQQNGRRYVADADLPAVVALLGLETAPATPAAA
jgi:hypothetical protein